MSRFVIIPHFFFRYLEKTVLRDCNLSWVISLYLCFTFRLIFANNPERWIYKYVRATKTEQPSVKIFTVDSVELNPNLNNASPQSVRERL